jgi:uncharacterized Zn finger protein
MRFNDFDFKTLDQIGSPEANAKARELSENNQVQCGYRLPDRLHAVVGDKEPFPVEVRIKDDQLSCFCSCTHEAGGEICPHALAVLWSWVDDPGRFLSRSDLQERLKKYSKKDLLDIIMDLADRVPDVRTVLKEEEQGLEEILESIDHIVEDVADDSMDPDRAESKLRRAQAWADRLAQGGRLAEARSIYFYLLDNILGLEERLQKSAVFSKGLKDDLFEEYVQFIHEDRQLERELVQQELEQLETRTAVTRGELDLSEVKEEVQGTP